MAVGSCVPVAVSRDKSLQKHLNLAKPVVSFSSVLFEADTIRSFSRVCFFGALIPCTSTKLRASPAGDNCSIGNACGRFLDSWAVRHAGVASDCSRRQHSQDGSASPGPRPGPGPGGYVHVRLCHQAQGVEDRNHDTRMMHRWVHSMPGCITSWPPVSLPCWLAASASLSCCVRSETSQNHSSVPHKRAPCTHATSHAAGTCGCKEEGRQAGRCLQDPPYTMHARPLHATLTWCVRW